MDENKINKYIDYMDDEPGVFFADLPLPSSDIDEELYYAICKLKYETTSFIELIHKD